MALYFDIISFRLSLLKNKNHTTHTHTHTTKMKMSFVSATLPFQSFNNQIKEFNDRSRKCGNVASLKMSC